MIIAWKFLKYISSHCCSLEQGLFLYLYLYQYFVLYFVFCICINILLGNLTVVRSSELGTSCRSRTSPSWERTPHKNRTEPPTRHLLSLDKPARLTIVPACQMRYKNTNSGTLPQGASFLQLFENPQRWRWYERGKNICSSKHKKNVYLGNKCLQTWFLFASLFQRISAVENTLCCEPLH